MDEAFQIVEAPRCESIIRPPSTAPMRDKPTLLQRPQVMREKGLWYLQGGDQVARASLAATELLEHGQSRGITDQTQLRCDCTSSGSPPTNGACLRGADSGLLGLGRGHWSLHIAGSTEILSSRVPPKYRLYPRQAPRGPQQERPAVHINTARINAY